ncbi:MAG: VaFE repeat-containing surface-anchored protein, partial [Erysipelotrichaceae bacterium]|nr:VaFE repeat-containing surface-anchored protein [Erysipelotrichaceae bacterium]
SKESEEESAEEPEETKKYITISYMFADATARDGVGSLPEEIMILLPEKETVEQGCDYEPKMPKEMEVSGYVFNGYEPFAYDNGDILYQGIWYKADAKGALLKVPMLRAAGSESFGYGGQQNWGLTGGWGYNGHNGFSIGGEESWCIDATVPLSEIGTSYDPLGSSGGRAAEIIAMGKMNGRSQAEIQAALWNDEGYASYVNGVYIDPNDSDFNSRGMYGYSVSTWGGAGLQTQAKSPSWWPLGGYVKVYKKAADTAFNYTANCPNNYSLEGAVYGVYSDSSCTDRVAKLTTDKNGETGTSGALDQGTYYVKEISPSPGFLLDPNIYPVSVTAGNTSSVTSKEQPINDPFYIELHKLDRRDSRYVNHLDEAQFTLRYFDAQTDNPTGNAKYTWVFKTNFDDEGKAIVKFDRAHFVNGDSIDALTNSAGLFFLPLGTFTIEETLAPKLYARDENVYVGRVQSVDGHAVASVNEKGYLDVDNEDLSQSEELQTVRLNIQKVDLETGKAELPEDHITDTATLEGGVFHIYRIGEYNTDKENPEIVSISPVDYGTLTTDEEGKCFMEYEPGTTDGLLPGRFKIIEEKAPNGFAINETEFVLEAPVKERNVSTFEYSIDIGDRLTRIQIEKLDDNGDLIPEDATATIQLIETETGRVVYEFVADGNAHVIKGLTTMMNYHLHEFYVAPNFRLAIDKDVMPIQANDSETHYYHMVDHGIEIHTTATFSDEGKKDWDNPSNKHYVADGVAHIFDEVSYKNVYEGETYILEGELWDKTDNRSLDNVVRKEFIPKYDVGIETMEFEQQLDDLDNHDLVVFETLYRVVTNDDGSKEEVLVTEHKDLEDEDQTIRVDELYRADFEVLKINADNNEEVLEGVTFHITSHRTKRDGVEEDYDLGEFTTDENGKIFIEKLKEDTILTIAEVKEKDPTWYRWEEPFTFDIGHDTSISLHTDPIENHQIWIGTSAKFEESDSKNYVADGVAHIIDTVNYKWLYKGDQYRFVATLIDKGTEDNPTEIEVMTVEHEFTAKGLNGSEDVSIEFNFDGMDNHDFVVFEELYHIITEEVPQVDEEGNPVFDEEGNPIINKVLTGEEPLVAEHKDIDDDDQTVHIDELYRAAMVLYKIGNGNRDIKLNGAYFNVSTRRTKRDGTVVEKDLGTYVTGGIHVERDAAFRLTVFADENLTTEVRSVDSSYNSSFRKQAVTLLTLPEGEYWVKVDGEDEAKHYEVAKGTIVLHEQPEDTEVTFTELVAPAGYYLDRKPFIVNVGHDYELERVENYRSNSLIIITNRIPDTGYDG